MSEEQAPAQNGALPQLSDMTDDDVFKFTRGIRVSVVTDLMVGGKVSGENSDRILLTNMLNGLDTQATNSKKLASDQKNSDNAAVIVAELLRNINKNTAFQVSPSDRDAVDVSFRVVPSTIRDVIAMPGEMDVAPAQLDYASFVRSQGKDVDDMGKNAKHEEADEETDY